MVVAGGFPAIVEKQTFEGSHSRCKHADSVAVVAVKAGADADGVYGKCLLAFSTVSFATLLVSLSLFFPELCNCLCWLYGHRGFAQMLKQGQIHNDSSSCAFSCLLMCFPFALPLGLKSKPLSFCCYCSCYYCWICLHCAESCLCLLHLNAMCQHLDVASLVVYMESI